MLLSNLVFSLRLPNIIGFNYQRMLILLTYKEPMNMFFDTVSRVKIFIEVRGVHRPHHLLAQLFARRQRITAKRSLGH